jgi:hypothetical protein
VNLKGIRDAIFAQADWAPTQSPEAIVRVNRFINRAYNQISLEAPFLFFESMLKFATQPDVVPTLVTDTLQVCPANDTLPTAARNPWVFYGTLNVGTPNAIQWKTDRSWDGRLLEITVTDAAGVSTTVRNRIRSIWKGNLGAADHFFITVEKPWDYATHGYGEFAAWRVYTDTYYLPDDVISVKSTRLFLGGENWPLDVVSQTEAEDYSLADKRSVVSHGTPRTMFRRPHFQMPAPTVAPIATFDSEQNVMKWYGPEPPGQFQYAFTYCWGKRDIQLRNPNGAYWQGYAANIQNTATTAPGYSATTDASHRMREPLWESAPSPLSETKTVAIVVTVNPANVTSPGVQLAFPNIDYMQGFFTTGTSNPTGAFDRYNIPQSGWYIRIYRRRLTADFTNYAVLGTVANTQRVHGAVNLQNIESPDAYHLLTELNIDELNDGNWIDRGEVIPDYSRRMRDIHGYQGVGLYPYPNKRFEVDLRCVRRPQELQDDQDAPLIHAEAVETLITRALVFLREAEGAGDLAALAMNQYERALANLTKRYGTLLPASRSVTRRMSRARPGRLRRGNLRRWYTLE